MNRELILNRVILRRENVDLSDIFEGSVDNIKANFDRVINKYRKMEEEHDWSVVFDCGYAGYDGGLEVTATILRWENKKEYDTRIAAEKRIEEKARKAKETKKARALAKALKTEADERELYEKLKNKFEVAK